MCNVAVYDGSTEAIIPGEQITALKMPFELSYDWFPSSGGVQLEMPTPFSPVAGDGISISGQTISNARPMSYIVYFQELTEQTIPGDEVTAIKFPVQMTYDWFPTSRVLQMHMPDPPVVADIRVNGHTYSANSFD